MVDLSLRQVQRKKFPATIMVSLSDSKVDITYSRMWRNTFWTCTFLLLDIISLKCSTYIYDSGHLIIWLWILQWWHFNKKNLNSCARNCGSIHGLLQLICLISRFRIFFKSGKFLTGKFASNQKKIYQTSAQDLVILEPIPELRS